MATPDSSPAFVLGLLRDPSRPLPPLMDASGLAALASHNGPDTRTPVADAVLEFLRTGSATSGQIATGPCMHTTVVKNVLTRLSARGLVDRKFGPSPGAYRGWSYVWSVRG